MASLPTTAAMAKSRDKGVPPAISNFLKGLEEVEVRAVEEVASMEKAILQTTKAEYDLVSKFHNGIGPAYKRKSNNEAKYTTSDKLPYSDADGVISNACEDFPFLGTEPYLRMKMNLGEQDGKSPYFDPLQQVPLSDDLGGKICLHIDQLPFLKKQRAFLGHRDKYLPEVHRFRTGDESHFLGTVETVLCRWDSELESDTCIISKIENRIVPILDSWIQTLTNPSNPLGPNDFVVIDVIKEHADLFPPALNNCLARFQAECSDSFLALWRYCVYRSKMFKCPLPMACTNETTDVADICILLNLHYPSHKDFWPLASFGLLALSQDEGFQKFHCVTLQYYQHMAGVFQQLLGLEKNYVDSGTIAFWDLAPCPSHNKSYGMIGTHTMYSLVSRSIAEVVAALAKLENGGIVKVEFVGTTPFEKQLYTLRALSEVGHGHLLGDDCTVLQNHPEYICRNATNKWQDEKRFNKLARLCLLSENALRQKKGKPASMDEVVLTESQVAEVFEQESNHKNHCKRNDHAQRVPHTKKYSLSGSDSNQVF